MRRSRTPRSDALRRRSRARCAPAPRLHGGTTGRPKAVTLTTRGELAELSAFLVDLVPDLTASDTFLHAAPIAHASGAFFLPSLVRGARSLVMKKFDPATFVALAEREQADVTFLVPTMLAMILEEPSLATAQLSLRRIAYGASPISPNLLRRAEERFGRVFAQSYGQAESPMVITCLRPDEHGRVGSCGRPFTCVEAAIVDDADRFLEPGDDRRDRLPRAADHGLLLEPARGDRRGLPQRLAAHGRHRPHGRGRLLLHPRPQERHAHLGRLQRVSARSGGRAAGVRRRGRGCGRGPARRKMGRPRARGHRGSPGTGWRRRARVRGRAARELQAPEVDRSLARNCRRAVPTRSCAAKSATGSWPAAPGPLRRPGRRGHDPAPRAAWRGGEEARRRAGNRRVLRTARGCRGKAARRVRQERTPGGGSRQVPARAACSRRARGTVRSAVCVAACQRRVHVRLRSLRTHQRATRRR